MAIAKKPQCNRLAAQQESPDDAAEKFIAGAVSSREEASQEDSSSHGTLRPHLASACKCGSETQRYQQKRMDSVHH